jgi:transposase
LLDHDTRAAIFRLRKAGHGLRTIAHALDLSRNAVRRVLRSGRPDVPGIERAADLDPHLDLVRQLYVGCGGNLVRVSEELAAQGIEIGYSTLTSFCRQHGIGTKPPERAGRYVFAAGEEMQHDTSPHAVKIGEHVRQVQCAELVLCYSRKVFAQVYPRWSRFECKAFLSEAIVYFGGAAGRCVIDNLSVVVARGVGADAVMAPEMEAFAKRFDFTFLAHEPGDKNRSAKVERNFDFIENNFYKGRHFASLADLNQQLRAWCDKVNRGPRRLWGERRQVPEELFLAERPVLKPLPIYIPEVYRLHSRRVDVEGYLNLDTNRYSVPPDVPVGRTLEIRETLDRVRIFDGHKLLCEHDRHEPGAYQRILLPEHRHPGRCTRQMKRAALPQEAPLRAIGVDIVELVERLKKRHGGRAARAIQRLYRMYLEYPTPYLVEAVRAANAYGLLDLSRIERMTLARIRGDFFCLPDPDDDDDPEPSDG